MSDSRAVGFFTDTTLCIGCKACEVACHQWNSLPALHGGQKELSGQSYDNTLSFSSVDWRHVKFIEQFSADRKQAAWLMMSDVCKHCVNAPCLEVCPTGAILRTEFDTVYIQEPACNGCRDCIAACPFGVIHMSESRNVAQKCTFCYDRLQNGLAPACAQACPTSSIRFGPIELLREQAHARVRDLQAAGKTEARLYGADERILGGLNSFYLLMDEPEVYGLPSSATVPSRGLFWSSLTAIGNAILIMLATLVSLRRRREPLVGAGQEPPPSGEPRTEASHAARNPSEHPGDP